MKRTNIAAALLVTILTVYSLDAADYGAQLRNARELRDKRKFEEAIQLAEAIADDPSAPAPIRDSARRIPIDVHIRRGEHLKAAQMIEQNIPIISTREQVPLRLECANLYEKSEKINLACHSWEGLIRENDIEHIIGLFLIVNQERILR